MGSEGSGFKEVQADAVIGVEGPWVEMIASSEFPSSWMIVQVSSDGTNSRSQFDIGTGEEGSEVEVITDQHFHGRNQSGGAGRGNIFSFPMVLPQGTRISMRFKANNSSTPAHDVTLTISDFVASNSIPTSVQSSGAKTVLSGNQIGISGSWVELVASLSSPITWMSYSVFGSTGQRRAEFDIGVGASGQESPVMDNIGFFKTFPAGVTFSMGIYFPIEIAVGLRVSVRVKDDDATIRTYTVGALLS